MHFEDVYCDRGQVESLFARHTIDQQRMIRRDLVHFFGPTMYYVCTMRLTH